MDTLQDALEWLERQSKDEKYARGSTRADCDTHGLHGLASTIRGSDAVAFFDATNTTRERRALICRVLQKFEEQRGCVGGINLIFLESVCNDAEVIQRNLLQKVRHSPDFEGMKEAEALADLRERVAKYEVSYSRRSCARCRCLGAGASLW